MEGQRQALAVRIAAHAAEPGMETAIVSVESHATKRGRTHGVLVQRAGGDVSVLCSCPASPYGLPCTHGALALDATAMWPSDMHLARQVGLEIDGTSDLDPDTQLCGCHGLPAVSRVFRPRYGDPLQQWACPLDDLVVGTVRADVWTASRMAVAS